MSRVHRLRRRAGHGCRPTIAPASLAATRVDWPLDPREAAWLDEHLAQLRGCRSVAAAYEADRLALRAMRDHQPEPPRDLWARTSAAIEGEAASRGGSRAGLDLARRGRSRSAPCRAIAVIVVVIGASVMSGGFLNARPGDTQRHGSPPIAVVSTTRAPGATPIAVGAGSVGWLGTSSNGGLAYNVDQDRRGLSGRAPARLRTGQRPRLEAGRPHDPAEVDLAVAGPEPGRRRRDRCRRQRLRRRDVPADAEPTSTPVPTSTPRSTATPSLTPEPTETPVASGSAVGELRTVRVRSDRAERDAEVHRPPRSSRRSNRRRKPTPTLTPEPDAVGEPGDHLRRQGRRPVGRLLAGRCLVRVHRAAVGRLGRPGYLRVARR